MSPDSRPQIVFMTGGEPALRPQLVIDIANRATAIGASPVILTGSYFARLPRIPADVLAALNACALVVASLDEFHEREVSRDEIFAALEVIRGHGKDVAIQLTARSSEDPYLHDAIASIRTRFADRVPIFLTLLVAAGRAADLGLDLPQPVERTDPAALYEPCRWATWPVVTADGAVVACCNGGLEAPGARPGELVLGDAATDAWSAIVKRGTESEYLRVVRALGPLMIADQIEGTSKPDCGDYCGTCSRVATSTDAVHQAISLLKTPLGVMLESRTKAALSRGSAFVAPEFRELTLLGAAG